ncbi:metallophosphatase domain-containing protein [Phanerochaete sordida]|uniref:Metallophosphatase domain-containing protein n=1 Tax=Phanerochaete sordida TaxID=48140 RepID=A0A9P3GK21_9APHY|nr:metallophosphatase domain-containing protein [Phanerochaete sordida]
MPLKDNYTSSTANVYVTYDLDAPPEHPGPEWTRFVCISDTHSRKFKVPDGDVLLHSGDISSWGYLVQVEAGMKWIESLPHRIKVVVAGNHDLCLDEEWADGGYWEKKAGDSMPLTDVQAARAMVRSEKLREAGIHYLEHESTTIVTESGRSWEIYGSPATPRFAFGAFQYKNKPEAREVYSRIPPSAEILLTHTPPSGMLDMTKKRKKAGCPILTDRLASDDLAHLRLHVFGHIHEAHGAEVQAATDNKPERVYVNAAVPDSLIPVIVDLHN